MHFPKKENTLSQHNTTQHRWQPTPRRSPGAAWSGPDTQQGDSGLGRGGKRGRDGRKWGSSSHCWPQLLSALCFLVVSVFVCVCICKSVCVCCAWWKCKVMMGASFNLPSAYRLPCGCSRRVSATVPPPFPLSLPYHRPRPICVVCVYVCVPTNLINLCKK